MNQVHRKTPFIILVLLISLGAGAVAFAFWLVDHRQAITNSEIMIAIALGVFFLSYTGAFLLYVRWRDSRRGMSKMTIPSTERSSQNLEGTIYGMIPESQYQVIRSFTDYYGNSFEQREILRFKERYFLPYEGGHTLVFEERSLFLQEEKNEEIVEHFSEYIVRIRQRPSSKKSSFEAVVRHRLRPVWFSYERLTKSSFCTRSARTSRFLPKKDENCEASVYESS